MHRFGKKILVLMAIWLLTGGLAFADSFDLTDELQRAFFDRACALETGLDEARESIGDAMASLALKETDVASHPGVFPRLPPCLDPVVLALLRPLPEVLQTFRI